MLKLSERVTHEQAVKEYEQNYRFWQNELEQESENAMNKMNIFLQFPDGIWTDVEGLNSLEKIVNQQMDSNANGNKDEDPYLASVISASEMRIDERMSITSSVFSDANAQHLFESSLKRSEARPDQLSQVSSNSRLEQFIILRRIYINQFLILLTTIVKESKISAKIYYEKCVEILNIAESEEFDDVINRAQMNDLILKLHESFNRS